MSLTDEDRSWILEQLATNAATARVANDELRTSLTAANDELRTSLTAANDELRMSLTAAIERVETSLLTAFHQWASPLEIKVRAHGMAIGAFDGERENSIEQAKKLIELERRIAKLEKAS